MHRGWWRGPLAGSGLALALLAGLVGDARAQEAEAAAAGDPIRELVAPVALYPDPLLAAVLQASLFPIDVVQADRFLDDYAQDQTLTPSPDWDPALVALLNYPSIIDELNADLDWTQALGDAVYEQIEAVQDAIQDLRTAAYSMGMLASNEVQEVVIEGGIVAIRPASPDAVAIPDYDGAALIAALETVAAAPPAAPEAETAAAEPAPAEAAASAEAAAPTATATAEVTIEVQQAEVQQAEAAPAEAYAYAEPAAPTYASAPVYAAPPPPVYYAEPAPSYWGTGAAFAGGAILGGLLGYALADDDDDDWDWDDADWDGGDIDIERGDIDIDREINIEDSNIVVGGDRVRRTDSSQVTAGLRDRRDSGAGAAPRRERERAGTTVAALPDPGRAAARAERGRGDGAQALRAPADRGAVAAVKRPSETRRDAERGRVSRAQAGQRRAAAPQRQVRREAAPQRQQLAQRGGGDGRGALAPRGGQRQVEAHRQRGAGSRGRR